MIDGGFELIESLDSRNNNQCSSVKMAALVFFFLFFFYFVEMESMLV